MTDASQVMSEEKENELVERLAAYGRILQQGGVLWTPEQAAFLKILVDECEGGGAWARITERYYKTCAGGVLAVCASCTENKKGLLHRYCKLKGRKWRLFAEVTSPFWCPKKEG